MYGSKKSSVALTSGVLMSLFLHSRVAASRIASASRMVTARLEYHKPSARLNMWTQQRKTHPLPRKTYRDIRKVWPLILDVSAGSVGFAKIIMTKLGSTTIAAARVIRVLDQTVHTKNDYAGFAEKKSCASHKNRRRLRYVPVRRENSTATGCAEAKV